MKSVAPLFLAVILAAPSALAQNAAPPPKIDTVTVDAPKTPLEKAVESFVKAYATPSIKIGKIPKWGNGICPKALGLTAELNLGVSERLKQVADAAGAPVAKEPCETNVTILFTRTPQSVLDDMAKNHQDQLGYHDAAQLKDIATMRHPIQAWYATATRDYNGTVRPDRAQHDPLCDAIDTSNIYSQGSGNLRGSSLQIDVTKFNNVIKDMYQYCGGAKTSGNHLNDGLRSEFQSVTIIADFDKVSSLGMRPLSDYIALLALSQTQAFETCQPISSIVNLLTPDCAQKSEELSAGDLTYLSALYAMDPDSLLAGQQTDIAHKMATTLGVR